MKTKIDTSARKNLIAEGNDSMKPENTDGTLLKSTALFAFLDEQRSKQRSKADTKRREQQKIAITKACGWCQSRSCHWEGWWYLKKDKRTYRRYPPDYLNDLNAMHEAIMSLTLEEQCNMTEILRKDVIKFTAPTITATAAQRAEAFLRTLNLWTDE